MPGRTLLSGAVISLFACILVWSLWNNGYIPYWRVPLELFTPGDWWSRQRMGEPAPRGAENALEVYRFLIAAVLLYVFGRLGNWRGAFEHAVEGRTPRARATAATALALLVWILVWTNTLPGLDMVFMLLPSSWLTGGGDHVGAATVAYTVYGLITLAVVWPFARLGRWRTLLRPGQLPQQRAPQEHARAQTQARAAAQDPSAPALADWPELRARGLTELADRLSDEVRSGRMNDVDYTRVRRAWRSVQADPGGSTPSPKRCAGAAPPRARTPRAPATCRCARPGTICSYARSGSARSTRASATRTPGAAAVSRSNPNCSAPRCWPSDRPARARPGTWCGPWWSPSPSRHSRARPPSSRWRRPAPSSVPTTRTTSWSNPATPRPSTTSTSTAARPTPTRPPPYSPRRSPAISPRSTAGARPPRSPSCSAPTWRPTAASLRCPTCGNSSTGCGRARHPARGARRGRPLRPAARTRRPRPAVRGSG